MITKANKYSFYLDFIKMSNNKDEADNKNPSFIIFREDNDGCVVKQEDYLELYNEYMYLNPNDYQFRIPAWRYSFKFNLNNAMSNTFFNTTKDVLDAFPDDDGPIILAEAYDKLYNAYCQFLNIKDV